MLLSLCFGAISLSWVRDYRFMIQVFTYGLLPLSSNTSWDETISVCCIELSVSHIVLPDFVFFGALMNDVILLYLGSVYALRSPTIVLEIQVVRRRFRVHLQFVQVSELNAHCYSIQLLNMTYLKLVWYRTKHFGIWQCKELCHILGC